MENINKIAVDIINSITQDVGLLSESIPVGDKHPNGSVYKLKFSSGNKFIVKPRSAVGELLLYEMEDVVFGTLGIANNTPKHLFSTKDICIFECIPFSTVSNFEMSNYFNSVGIKAALLFCLGASDISLDNVILYKNRAIIIDAETLFSPDMIDIKNRKAIRTLSPSYCSLARTGFFPSNYIFSPIYTEKQLDLLYKKDKIIFSELSKFPAINANLINSLLNGFFACVNVLNDAISTGLIQKIIKNHSLLLGELRVILRPTKNYIDHLNGVTKIPDLISLEQSHLDKKCIPYFTYNSLNINFNANIAINLVSKLLEFCTKNPSYIKRHIELTCL